MTRLPCRRWVCRYCWIASAVLALAGSAGGTKLPIASTFEEHEQLDGWVSDGTELSWKATGGNLTGHIAWSVGTAGGDFIRAPEKFLGNWSGYDEKCRLSWDFRLGEISFGAFFAEMPFEAVISGPEGSAHFRGSFPLFGVFGGQWRNIRVPIRESDWDVDEGRWAEILSKVTSLQIRIGHGVSTVDGNKGGMAGLDNVMLAELTSSDKKELASLEEQLASVEKQHVPKDGASRLFRHNQESDFFRRVLKYGSVLGILAGAIVMGVSMLVKWLLGLAMRK